MRRASRLPSRCSSRPAPRACSGPPPAACHRWTCRCEDLRSRLGWGDVHALHPLTESDTRSALRREAARRGIELGDEVIDYLLTRLRRDMSHLMNLLDRLDGYALAEQRAVTIPLLRKMLAEEGA